MNKIDNPKIHPVFAAFLILFLSFLFYQFIGGILVYLIVGAEVTQHNAGLVRILSTMSQILFLLFVPIVAARAFYNDFIITFKIAKVDWIELLLSFLGLFFIILISQFYIFLQANFLNYLESISPSAKEIISALKSLDKLVEQSYINLIKAVDLKDLFSIILAIALTPAFCEEFLFRGFALTSLEQKLKPFWAIFITGLIFSIYHFNLLALLPLMVIGIYFGYIAYKTNTIFIPIILHFINNLTTILLFYFVKENWVIETAPNIEINNQSLIVGFFSSIFLFFAIMFILNKYQNFKKGKRENNYVDLS